MSICSVVVSHSCCYSLKSEKNVIKFFIYIVFHPAPDKVEVKHQNVQTKTVEIRDQQVQTESIAQEQGTCINITLYLFE